MVPRKHGLGRAEGLAAAHLEVMALPRTAYTRLQQQAVAAGVTPFNYFFAALALYFARTTERDTIVVGVPSLNRGGRRFRDTLGMFVGVMAVQVHIRPGMTATELVASVGLSMRGALRHPRYPLSEFARVLQVVRSGRDRVFDVLLSFERQDYAVSFGDAALVDSRQLFSRTARYPLGVTVCEFHDDQDLELILEGSDAFFDAADMAPLAHRLWHVVQALAFSPDVALESLSVLPPEEHAAVVHGLHAGVPHHADPGTWVAAFEAQALLRPLATALVWDGGSMDYSTLDQRANRLAHRLAALGAEREHIVALCMPRSPELVVALLAIAKAGAAFLPLDPDAPIARMADILSQSEAVALLVNEENWERLAHLHERTAVTNWGQALSDTPVFGPPTRAAAQDLAYVLFTSGSTGRPKGVMVEHAVLSRRLAWLTREYGADTHDRSALSTQYTFDPFLIELCVPLINGGSVALPPPGRLLPETVADFAIRHGVTIMAFVPSTVSGLLDAVGDRPGLKLRVVCSGGEVLSPDLANRYLARTGGRLFNVYGPTEACIFATAYACQPQASDEPLPIGRAIDDTAIYVLDAQLQPLPFGVAGEVYIGGDTLARGYLGQPELTAKVFVADPFRHGARMYRTGDRGWLGADGQLHFVGRIDRQIKLRGYRIELGEIEAALLAVEGVHQAAAKLVQRHGRPAIQAWAATSSGLEPDHLQRVLRVRLPDYMVPSGITVLPMLATTGTGKVDYDALPDTVNAAPTVAVREPANALERDVLGLWAETLQNKSLTVHDNFFDAGGDSLAAVGILAGIEGLLGRKVPLYLLTENPTVESLVAALNTEAGYPGTLVDLGSDVAAVPLYIAASGHGDLMRFRNLGEALAGVCNLQMLQPPLDTPVQRITELAALYADRIQAQDAPPGFIAGFSIGGITALETARVLAARGTPVRGLILLDTVYPRIVWGGTFYWRLFTWLVRTLRLQDLSINRRRLGAMVNDSGLVGQVMAMSGYRIGAYDGPTYLIKTQGLSRWDRALFHGWRKLQGEHLLERRVVGLHGSIFERHHVDQLASALGDVVRGTP